jgi:hypothetical protein
VEGLQLSAIHQAKNEKEMRLLTTNSNFTFSAAKRKRNAQAITPAHVDLEGVEFEEDDTQWRVIDVRYSKQLECMVVWYYDVDKAFDLNISLEEMIVARNSNTVCDPLENSSVEEVNAWIKLSSERFYDNNQQTGDGGGSEDDEDEEEEEEEEEDFDHMPRMKMMNILQGCIMTPMRMKTRLPLKIQS